MVFVKILGGIDLISSFVFLLIIFGIHPFVPLMLFCASLLLVKGLFAFTGEPLSFIDLFSALCLFLSIFFTIPAIFLWIPAFFLLAKGFVSFV